MTARSFVSVRNLRRDFVTSKPWLAGMLGGGGRETLTAVDDVSFDIAQGEIFALVGESGSGKSTLARMVVGLLPPTGGVVEIDGVAITGPAALRRRGRPRLQMIVQNPFASLNPRWRVSRIVADPIHAFGLAKDKAETEHRVAAMLRLVGLDPADGAKYPHEFSGGQRQRICIARALSSNPDFLVCDEPTSALDVSVQAQILNLMRDLQDRLGLTCLFISHNLAVVRHMATRVGVMYLGRIVEMAPAAELIEAPRHPYTRMLLDALPDLAMMGRERRPIEGEIPNPIAPPSGCAFHPRCPHAFGPCRLDVPALKEREGRAVACHAVETGRI
jgi:peptide/nickel transport system ATP-binding protein